MKAKSKARTKRARKPSKSRSKSAVSVTLAGRVTSFFKKKGKKPVWSLSRVLSVLGASK